MPWLDKVLHKNPLVAMLSELILKPAMSPVLKFAVERIAERKKDFHDHPEKRPREGLFDIISAYQGEPS